MTALAWGGAIAAQLALGLWLANAWGFADPACTSWCRLGSWAGVSLFAIVGVQLAFAAITTLVAAATPDASANARSSSHATAGPAAAARRLWVVFHEAGAFAFAQVLMALEPLLTRSWRDSGVSGNAPVLLIHGIYCNRAVWWQLRRRLLAAGAGPILAINLEPAGAAIDTHMPVVRRALERLQALVPNGSITIVAHSMGGLVARGVCLAAARGAPPVARIVTIATPHYGSRHAWLCVSGACREMRPGSAWLRRLQSAETHTEIVAIHSVDDNLVAPRSSAVLLGARSIAFRALGHFGLLWSRAVAASIVAELAAPAVGGAARVADSQPV